MSVRIDWTIELELSPGVWTDVSADVRAQVPVVAEIGIRGSGILDRVASTGTMTFALDNSEKNSAGLLGYYAPDHANCRSGFDVGIGVRWYVQYDDGATVSWKYLFVGTIDTVQPVPGKYGPRLTLVSAVDWMEEAARGEFSAIGVQVGKRSDQVFSAVLAGMPVQPDLTDIETGSDTYAYALDGSRSERTSVMTEFQRIAVTEGGQIYVEPDQDGYAVLKFDARTTRVLASSADLAVLDDDDLRGLDVERSRANVLNHVEAVVHPRRVDTSYVVLFSVVPSDAIQPSESVTFFGPYRDPNQEAARVGGTDMQTPVATTDYTFNSAADGSGSNLTSDFSVTVNSFGASGVSLTVTNNGTVAGYATKLQVRGKGIYDYEQVQLLASDATSQSSYGLRRQQIDLWYQGDPVLGQERAQYALRLYKDAATRPRTLTFVPNKNGTLADLFVTAGLSRLRYGVRETASGVTDVISGTSATRGFFINAMRHTMTAGGIFEETWTLAPSDDYAYWILEQVGASELDVTTRLAYA